MELKEILQKFEGATLTEDVVASLVTALQEAIDATTDDHSAEIQALKEEHAAAFATASDVSAERINEAANAAVESMLAENKERFVQADQYERMQSMFESVKKAFEDSGFELQAPDTALTESLTAKTEAHADAIKRLAEARAEVTSLTESLKTANRAIVLAEMTKNLSDLQRAKLDQLCEGLTFVDEDAFAKGIGSLIEQLQEAAPGPAEGKRNLEKEKANAALGADGGDAPAVVPVGSGGTDKKEIDALKEAQAAEAAAAAEKAALMESLGGLNPETCSIKDLAMRGLSIHNLPFEYQKRFYG